ncbi:MAG: hypothetical protein ABSF09_14405, partial [Candidatus Bathyarchaeia archaeon]
AYVPQIVQQPISPGRQVINGTLMQQPYSRALYQGQQNTTWLMVVAIVIAFSVVVAVVFAVIATRNRQQQQYWPPSIQNQR